MAHQEACQVFIEQEIDKGLKDGKKPYTIGKELTVWLEKLFEAKIPPTTIEKRAERIRATFPTNVGNDSLIKRNQGDMEDNQTGRGGYRHNAGWPTRKEAERRECEKKKRMDEERMDTKFKEAFDSFYEQIRKAKKQKWESTSKKAALNCVQWMHDLITLD